MRLHYSTFENCGLAIITDLVFPLICIQIFKRALLTLKVILFLMINLLKAKRDQSFPNRYSMIL